MSKICLILINFYQRYLSFDRGLLMFFAPAGACKFEPSCSEFTKQMVGKYGTFRGLYLGLKRILSCR